VFCCLVCAATTVLDCQVHCLFSEIYCLLFLYLQNQVQVSSKRTEQEVEYTELNRIPPDIFLQIRPGLQCFLFCVLCLGSWVSNKFSLVFFVFKFRVPSCVQESAELKFVFESLVCKNSVFICALSSNWVFFQIFLTRNSFELSKPLRSSRPYHKPLVFWLKVSQVLWKNFFI